MTQINFLEKTIEIPETDLTPEDMTHVLTTCRENAQTLAKEHGLKLSSIKTTAQNALAEALSIVAEGKNHSTFFIENDIQLKEPFDKTFLSSLTPAHTRKNIARYKLCQMSLYIAPAEYIVCAVEKYVKASIEAEIENRRPAIVITVPAAKKR